MTVVRNCKTMCLPIDVDLCGVELANLLGDADNDGESLVEFKEGDIVNSEVSLPESLRKGDGRCFREVDGVYTSIGPR